MGRIDAIPFCYYQQLQNSSLTTIPTDRPNEYRLPTTYLCIRHKLYTAISLKIRGFPAFNSVAAYSV